MWLLCCKVSTGWAGGPQRCMEAGAPWPSCCITPPSSAASPGAPHQPFSSSPGSVVTADCYNNRREIWYTTYFVCYNVWPKTLFLLWHFHMTWLSPPSKLCYRFGLFIKSLFPPRRLCDLICLLFFFYCG